jgi:hypothetical protein
MPPNPHTVKPHTMHLLDITVNNDKQQLDMAQFHISNLQPGKFDEDAVNVSQLTSVERKFDEEVIGVKASITSHGNRLTTHDGQLTVIEALVNHPQIGPVMLDRRLDNVEALFSSDNIDGVKGQELLDNIKKAYTMITEMADSDIATTLIKLHETDVEHGKKLDVERERATTAERTITEILSNETEERIKEDGLIRLDFAKADKDLETALSDAVKAETQRATSSETAIDKKRDDDLKRAIAAEGSLAERIAEVDSKHDSKTEEVRADLAKKIEDNKKSSQDADIALGQKIDGVDAKHDAKNDELEMRLEIKIDGVETKLETKINEVETKLDLEDAKIRQEVLNLGAEFNGLLNSSNENLGLQIKNVADTLASLITKLFGKDERFVGEIIIKDAIDFQ